MHSLAFRLDGCIETGHGHAPSGPARWRACRSQNPYGQSALGRSSARRGGAFLQARCQLVVLEGAGISGCNELGALPGAAGLGTAQGHALMSLLALNGLRISEALGTDVTAMGSERGHRTLTLLRKGGKIVTIPLAPRTARSLDLAIGELLDGPIFRRADGQRLDRHGASRIVRRLAKRAGIAKAISPHTLRHTFITAALDAGVPLRDVQEAASHADPRTTMRYDRARASLDRHATYIVAAYLADAAR